MKIQIEIRADNSAFDGDSGSEVARILRELADRVDGSDVADTIARRLYDVNGNSVGKADWTED
jgi:hypothetical protein